MVIVIPLNFAATAQAFKSSGPTASSRYYSYPLTPASKKYIDTKFKLEKLNGETNALYMRFMWECKELLVQKRVPVKDLRFGLNTLIGSDEPELSAKLKNVDDINEFLEVLNLKMSYYHYGHLAILIDHFGKEKGNQILMEYESKLRLKLKNRIVSDPKLQKNVLCVKIDKTSKHWKEEDTEHFVFFFTNLFNKNPSDIILHDISSGCIRLVFLISDSFATSIQSSCKDARICTTLAEEKVMELRING